MHKLVKTFMKDHNNAVREQTMASLAELKGVFGTQITN